MSYNIYIDSKDRQYGNEEICDFSVFSVFDINDMFAGMEKDISLTQITIPNSIYNINDNNNTFTITSSGLEITGGTNISLTNGNYNNTTFCN